MTYGFSECTDKVLKDRLRYLSDKMDALWYKLEPMIDEFTLLKIEFLDLVQEINSRGVNDETQQQGKS
jgi:hypothetical protein